MDPITDIVGQGRDAQAQASKIYGVVIGIVVNNQDPEKLGRVKVKFPWLADDVESFWARPAYPMNGKERGFWWIPEIDDEVLIAFEHGDPNRPYLLGGLYNGVDKPPIVNDITDTFAFEAPAETAANTELDTLVTASQLNEDGKNDLRFIRSRSGHLFIFSDEQDKERIILCDKTGEGRIEISSDKNVVRITSAGGNGDIELFADNRISIVCKELYTESRDKTQMEAGATFDVHSVGDMTHKTDANMVRDAATNIDETAGSNATYSASANFTAEAGSAATVKGSTLSLKGSASGELDGGGTLTVKGGMVNIN